MDERQTDRSIPVGHSHPSTTLSKRSRLVNQVHRVFCVGKWKKSEGGVSSPPAERDCVSESGKISPGRATRVRRVQARSSASRTFRPRTLVLNGFCRKVMPFGRTPRLKMNSSA